VAEEQRPGLGRFDDAPTARALEQSGPGGPLERGDLLADGRLRIAELRRRAGKGPFAGDDLEGHEVTEIDPEQKISFHDSSL
jgi:hypothetical protein